MATDSYLDKTGLTYLVDKLNTKYVNGTKVTSISSSSTDEQVPSAKCVYNTIGDVEAVLATLNSGSGV